MIEPAFYSLREAFFNKPGSKRFYCPAKIHWGYDSFALALKALAGLQALVFFDEKFLHTSFLARLQEQLHDESTFLTVASPPSPEQIARVTNQFGEMPDCIVALGGGSTIDTAKAYVAQIRFGNIDGIGMGHRRGEGPSMEHDPLFVAIPSTAGTGAETSRYYVTYAEKAFSKVHGKNWGLIAGWVFLDPEIACTAPAHVKYESALDAFIHLCESFLCQEEESWVNSALCLAALRELRQGLDALANNIDSREGMLRLLSAASFGGVAISNVRTGHLHEMAGALLEHTGLTHPQSLSVFLEEGMAVLLISPSGARKLEQLAVAFCASDWQDVIGYWRHALSQVGITQTVRKCLSELSPGEMSSIKISVSERTLADSVWNAKECPLLLTRDIIEQIFDRSLSMALETKA